jgi:hypothetical protein
MTSSRIAGGNQALVAPPLDGGLTDLNGLGNLLGREQFFHP